MKDIFQRIINPALISGVMAIVVVGIYHYSQDTQSQRIYDYYHTEVATLESPHGIRKAIAKGSRDFILVDVRSQQEYEQEHIVGALNVPSYSDPDTSAYNEVDRIVNGFKDIIKQYPDRDIIIYCYSSSCMSGRKIGRMLSEHGIYAKELGIGWNEWRYDWNMWNYPHEWETTDVMDYVFSGVEPGEYSGFDGVLEGCSLSAEFNC